MIQIQEFFLIIEKNQHAFLVLKGVTPTFSNLGILLKIDMKNCPLLGKLLSVWRTVSVLAKSAQSAQTVKPHIAFSMFPILDTNLWYKHRIANNSENPLKPDTTKNEGSTNPEFNVKSPPDEDLKSTNGQERAKYS